jgi:hypothetical protein
MQLRPRLTGDSGSPLTATTLPSRVAIMIPQPTPQKRHTDLSHFQPSSSAFALARASSGTQIPRLLATEAATAVLMKSRRV